PRIRWTRTGCERCCRRPDRGSRDVPQPLVTLCVGHVPDRPALPEPGDHEELVVRGDRPVDPGIGGSVLGPVRTPRLAATGRRDPSPAATWNSSFGGPAQWSLGSE